MDNMTEYADDGTFNSGFMLLLVDDDTMVAEAVRQMVANEADIEFHYCGDPSKAVELAEQVHPTVILLDMVMPDIDGLTVLRYLRANPATQNIPTVVLSMKEDPALKAQVFSLGGNDYLIKLPDQIEVLARIRYHSQSYQRLLQRDEAYRALRVSQKKLAESNLKLQQLATSDGLTGIANRRQFDDSYAIEWRRSVREQAWLSIIMLDIDYFKLYNDKYGHQLGDEVLIKIAQTIKDSVSRPTDLAARYGGEEFVVMLPETDASGAKIIAERIHHNVLALEINNEKSSISKHITVSLGIATTVPALEEDPSSLILAADQALYRAKEDGRNGVAAAPVMATNGNLAKHGNTRK